MIQLIQECDDSGICSGFVVGIVFVVAQYFWTPITNLVNAVGGATIAFADDGF